MKVIDLGENSMARSTGWMYKIDKFRLKNRCTSLIAKLNHQWKNFPRDVID